MVGLAVAITLVTVSGRPFATCSNDSQTGKNYVNAEVEPYVAVDPMNAMNVIGVWQAGSVVERRSAWPGRGFFLRWGRNLGRDTTALQRLCERAQIRASL